MLTISDIRALAKNRFDCKYEKIAMIVMGLFFAWILIAAACQGFTTMDKTFTYAIPDSSVKIMGNSMTVSYDLTKLSFNDYNINRIANEETKKGNLIYFVVGLGIPMVVLLVLAGMYGYKRDRYTMAFQQKWLETGLIPDMDKI